VWLPGSADTVCPRRPLRTQVHQWANTYHNDDVTLRTWPLTLEVMAPVADAAVVVLHPYTKFEVRRPCHSEDMAHDVCEHQCTWWPWPLTFWSWNWYASCIKGRNLPSKFWHARPLGSRIIRYVCDGRTNGRTDKSNAYCPIPTCGGIITDLSWMWNVIPRPIMHVHLEPFITVIVL